MISTAIIKAYEEKYHRKWGVLYFAVDLHGTIIERYTGDDLKIYPFAEQTLKVLSKRSDIALILFTSSYPDNLKPFYDWCTKKGIHFKYLNENPECPNNKTGDFSRKFYFNVLLDDRAGFDPDTDWEDTLKALEIVDIKNNCPNIEVCKRSFKFFGESNICLMCSKHAYIFYETKED